MEGLQIGGIIVSGAEYMNYGIFNGLGHGEIMAHKELLVQELIAFLGR